MAKKATNMDSPLFVIDSFQSVSTLKSNSNFSLSLVDDEIIRSVIQKVQIHPELWNIKSLAYKVSNKTKSNVYKDFDKAVYNDGKKDKEGNAVCCRNIWNKLVERYRAERKKSTDRASGSSPYKSNWPFYNEMRFLDEANSDSFMRTVTQNLEQDLPSMSGAALIESSTSRFIDELLQEENQPRTWNMSQSKDLLSFESGIANWNRKPRKRANLSGESIEAKKIMDLEEAKAKLIEARKLQEDRDKEKKLAENRAQLNLHYSRFLELELNMLSPFGQDRLKNGINELLRLEKMGANYDIIYDRPDYQEEMYPEGAAQFFVQSNE